MENLTAINTGKISISVVSHAQIDLIGDLLQDLEHYCQASSFELIVTLNMDETLPFALESFTFPIKIIRNIMAQGFAANHNQAFMQASGQFFCVLNPDIRLQDNPFPALLSCLQKPAVGVVAPLVLNETGAIDDSARRFPTPVKILCKAFGRCKGSDYRVSDEVIFPDWIAGMFMLFPYKVFNQLAGFDSHFFLYYEDVNLCARLRLQGYEVVLCPDAKIVHQAHRSSHHSFKYFKWHLVSMMRFFCSPVFLKILWRKFISA
jgi:GT2 family glycosyltransferase